MAVEQVIRSVQQRLREGEAGAVQSERQDLLRQIGQQIRRRLVETAELDPHAPEARDKARLFIQRFLEEAHGKRLAIQGQADRLPGCPGRLTGWSPMLRQLSPCPRN